MTVETTMQPVPVFKLVPTTQQYDWGKIGREAKVVQFAEASGIPGFTVQEDKPYAELWMGTHPSSPSTLRSTGEPLAGYLARHPQLIGESIINKFPDAKQGNLPFLFKILSIAKALSIQSHPDKATAEKLHKEKPGIYKDPNHKPEMALALTPFRALCGFRPLTQIADNLRSTPELAGLVPPTVLESFYTISGSSTPEGAEEKAALRAVFEAVMTTPEAKVKETVEALVNRYTASSTRTELESLILTLHSQFPYDIGLLCPFLLNYLNLSPGQAIFLGANEPHAYISGEALECMANSDNVIRAGLTPKLRDVANLVNGLTYRSTEGSVHEVQPGAFGEQGGKSVLYDPPIEEFSVVKVEVGQEGEKQRAVDGPSIAIVTEGKGVLKWEQGELEVGLGDVVFVGAGVPVEVLAREGEAEGVTVYRAFVEA